jgi:hypothetical protein
MATIAQQIKLHEEQVLQRASVCYRKTCPRCCGRAPFVRHDIRRRTFRCVQDGEIQTFRSWLVRWQCPSCNRTFTDYPPFALPYKRFVKSTILSASAEYVGEEGSTYRAVALPGGARIDDHSKGQNTASFSHSTLWRWLTWLAAMPQSVNVAAQLIRQKDSNVALHREAWEITRGHYRSTARRFTLQTAFRTLGVAHLFERLFEVPLFPNFATTLGFS